MYREQVPFGPETEHECGIIGMAREEAVRAADEVAVHLRAYLDAERAALLEPVGSMARYELMCQARQARAKAYAALDRWKLAVWG